MTTFIYSWGFGALPHAQFPSWKWSSGYEIVTKVSGEAGQRSSYCDHATGLTVWGSNPGRKSLSFPECPDRLWGPTQPPAQWVPGSFPEVTRQRREVQHPPSHSAEVMNEWSYSPAPLYAFMTLTGITLPLFLTKCKRSTSLPSQEKIPPLQTKELH